MALTAVSVMQLGAAEQPNAHLQPLIDGCQRSNAMELSMTTSEWVYVNRAGVLKSRLAGDALAGRQSLDGLVEDVHPAGDDLYWDHDVGDIDVEVKLDPASVHLARAGDDGLGMEWEDNQIPMWAWPQVGDRVHASGSWIWDCGHWGNGAADPTMGVSQLLPYDPVETIPDLLHPGVISGESTEIHPLQEVASYRKDAAGLLGGVPRRLARLDAWISGDGGWALAEEECGLLGLPTVTTRLCSRYRDVGGTYTYRLPLAPRPSLSSTLIVNPIVVHDESTAAVPVTTSYDASTNELVVRFALRHNWVVPGRPFALSATKFGVTVEAGWNDDPTPVEHHVVTLDQVHIQRSLDVPQPLGGSEPNQNPIANGPELTLWNGRQGEWSMVAQANGHWVKLFPLPTRSALVSDDQTIPLGITIDYYLPAGVTPRLYVSGRECDIPTMDCVHDYYGGKPSLLNLEVGYNDHPGRVVDNAAFGNFTDVGRPMLAGSAVYTPRPNPDTTNPSGGNEWDSDYTCGPEACYQITATLS